MFEFESQFGTVILECACAVCVMCAVLVVSHWWYLIGGMDRMVYLFGGISLVVYLIGGISLVVSHYRVLPGTTRGRGRGSRRRLMPVPSTLCYVCICEYVYTCSAVKQECAQSTYS